MSSYTILQRDNLPEILKNKPRWVTFLTVTVSVFAIIGSAIAIGIFIGYTYCYLEHHSGFRPVTGNITESSNYHTIIVPDSEEAQFNRTINGAIMSSVLVSRILKLGHALVEEEYIPLPVPWHDVRLQYTS